MITVRMKGPPRPERAQPSAVLKARLHPGLLALLALQVRATLAFLIPHSSCWRTLWSLHTPLPGRAKGCLDKLQVQAANQDTQASAETKPHAKEHALHTSPQSSLELGALPQPRHGAEGRDWVSSVLSSPEFARCG